MFLGRGNDNADWKVSSEGHAFTSRPYGFSFWYKYAPNGSDLDALRDKCKAAAAKVAGAKGFNAALVALLNGNTAPAAALKCDCPCAAYLRAIAAARNGDADGVKKNLETAKKCEKLAERAAKDVEFAQYR